MIAGARTSVLAGVGVALAVAMLLLLAFCRPKPTPIPPKEKTTIDSLAATKPAFDAGQAATKGAIVNVVTKIVRDEAAIAAARSDADRERRRADSLARAAAVARTAADSAERYRLAYDASSRESTNLRAALDTATRDLAAARDTLNRTRIQVADDSSRIARHIELEARLTKDLEHAEPPCRIAYVLRCPSRKVVAATAAVVTYLATRKDVRDKVTSTIKGALP
jgi:hypothetical protein